MESVYKDDIIICECNDPSHQLIFRYDKDDNQIYVDTILLQYNNIFKRIFLALKYIFKKDCKYEYYDGIIITKNNKQKFLNILNQIKDDKS